MPRRSVSSVPLRRFPQVQRRERERGDAAAVGGAADARPAAGAGVTVAPVGGQDAVRVGAVAEDGERVRVARLHLGLRLRHGGAGTAGGELEAAAGRAGKKEQRGKRRKKKNAAEGSGRRGGIDSAG